MKNIWRVLKKVKIELLYDPETPLLGIYLKEMRSAFQEGGVKMVG